MEMRYLSPGKNFISNGTCNVDALPSIRSRFPCQLYWPINIISPIPLSLSLILRRESWSKRGISWTPDALNVNKVCLMIYSVTRSQITRFSETETLSSLLFLSLSRSFFFSSFYHLTFIPAISIRRRPTRVSGRFRGIIRVKWKWRNFHLFTSVSERGPFYRFVAFASLESRPSHVFHFLLLHVDSVKIVPVVHADGESLTTLVEREENWGDGVAL